MMLGYAISMTPIIQALPELDFLGSSVAQRAEDSGDTIADINAPDPELVPRTENFKDIEINPDGAPRYQYAALKHPTFIRLLELWAVEPPSLDKNVADRVGYTIPQEDQSRKSIWCRIVHRDLGANPKPRYETISYTWAGLPKCIPIFVDQGKVIHLNAPLYACLQRLEIGSSPRCLWIDQVCLNQDDTKELNIQVLLMKSIFQSAHKTLIWLGEEDEDTPLAFECIRQIPALKHPPLESREVPSTTKTIVEAIIGKGIREAESPGYKARLVIGKLLNRGWFERAWVYQEAAVSSLVSVRIGSHEVDFRQFCTAIRAFCDVEREKWRSYGRSLSVATRGYNTLELVEYGRRYLAEDQKYTENAGKTDDGNEKDVKFLSLMLRLAGLVKATKPHDLIYAFLGFQDLERPLIEPDYSLSVSQVYTQAAQSFIQAAQNLDLFGITSLTERPTGLPSWAPDWTQRSPQGELLYRPDIPSSFTACKDFAHEQISSSDPLKYLVVKGKVIDTVALVCKHDFDLNDRNRGGLNVFLKLHQHLDFFRKAQPPPVTSKDQLGRATYTAPGSDDTLLRKPFADMFEGGVHQQKRLIKIILADNAYQFLPTETKTGQVPISSAELEDYHTAYVKEDAIRQQSKHLTGLERLTGVRNELRGNMLVSVKRRLFHGERACLGLAPQAVGVGDLVCVLHGSRVPCVLRRVEEGNTYELVGQCYYENWMYGDQVDWAQDDADTFELQ